MNGKVVNGNYSLRQAGPADVELAVEFRWLTFGGAGKAEAIDHIRREVSRRYAEEYEKGAIVHFFAEDEAGRPVASVGSLIKDDFPYYLFRPGRYGWIIDVFTRPEHRGRGLASALLDRNHQWLLAQGVTESKLLAGGHQAREFYARRGYELTWEMSRNLDRARHRTYHEMIGDNSRRDWGISKPLA